MSRLVLCLISFTVLAGCQTSPTKVSRSERPREGAITLPQWSDKGPLKITQDTVQIDVRPPFEYSLAHPVGAQPMDVRDFILTETEKQTYEQHATELARRLALRGIGPGRPHIVIGSGQNGKGEEAYVAWLLYALGVEEVSFVPFRSLKTRVTNELEMNVENIAPWTPQLKTSLIVTPAEFRKMFRDGSPFEVGQSKKTPSVVLLDVRDEAEFLKKERGGSRMRLPNSGALNIPLSEFFTSEGRVDRQLRERLKSLGIKPEQKILVIDNGGTRAGAAAMALLALDYRRAAVVLGGWTAFAEGRR